MGEKLKDKVAIITGSDSGIGRAMAQAFAEEGADIAITYLEDRHGAEQAKAEVEKAGRRAIVVKFDSATLRRWRGCSAKPMRSSARPISW